MNGAVRVRFFIVDSDLADLFTEGIGQERLERWRKLVEQENTYCGSQHAMTDDSGEFIVRPESPLLWQVRLQKSFVQIGSVFPRAGKFSKDTHIHENYPIMHRSS